jgi:hypothetical protein
MFAACVIGEVLSHHGNGLACWTMQNEGNKIEIRGALGHFDPDGAPAQPIIHGSAVLDPGRVFRVEYRRFSRRSSLEVKGHDSRDGVLPAIGNRHDHKLGRR